MQRSTTPKGRTLTVEAVQVRISHLSEPVHAKFVRLNMHGVTGGLVDWA